MAAPKRQGCKDIEWSDKAGRIETRRHSMKNYGIQMTGEAGKSSSPIEGGDE